MNTNPYNQKNIILAIATTTEIECNKEFFFDKDTNPKIKEFSNLIIHPVLTGIGKLNAYSSVEQKFFELKNKTNENPAIINIGTACSQSVKIGTTFIVDLFTQGDSSGSIKPQHIVNKLNTHCSITTSDNFLSDGSEIQTTLYDMEAYAIALFAKIQKVPFISLKIVSDNGKTSFEEWRDQASKLSKKLLESYASILARIVSDSSFLENAVPTPFPI